MRGDVQRLPLYLTPPLAPSKDALPLSALATRMVDGRVGRTWTDRGSSVERDRELQGRVTNMVLTSPRLERQPRVLAMVAMPLSRRSRLGDVVPMHLRVRKIEKRALELQDSTVKL